MVRMTRLNSCTGLKGKRVGSKSERGRKEKRGRSGQRRDEMI
jgi:hypothetical protein